jgi:NAD(P)-dependent dehydrogenase (short-subunit alcohol dehydrogenase family)
MKDKVILIVGATGGIGSALARKLAPEGVKFVFAAKDAAKLSAFAAQFPDALAIPTDITDPGQVETLMEKTVATYGRLDVLVNAAGAGVMKQYNKITPEDLDDQLNLNLKGSFYTSQAAANVMKDGRSGHICNVVGILGKHSMAMAAAYCASKYGMVGYSKCLAEEVKRYGIKVTLFYFGGVDTPFWDTVSLKVDRSKMLAPETAANAIYFALTAESPAVPTEITIQPDSHLFL